jgi:glycogen operon protein
MLLGGDEISRTQKGNNNAYCQDNEISWYDWENADKDLLAFCQKLIEYRKDHPVFRRRHWFLGQPIHGSEVKDIAWFTLEGEQMSEKHWGLGYAKSLGVFLNGATIPNPYPRGEPVKDDNFYVIFNAHHEALIFTLPKTNWGALWIKEFDTDIGWLENEETLKAESQIKVEDHSVVVLRQVT